MLGKIVVVIEATIEAGSESFAVEDDRADEGRRVVRLLLKQFGDGRMRGAKRHREIGDTMRAGQQSGENAGVGCVGDRTGRKRLSEADSVFRQSVECRRLHLVVSIAVNVIRAKSIDR